MTKHKKAVMTTPTKGKGGGKPGKGGKGESMEVKDCPLELKELEGMECPRYTGVLKRGDTEVSLEDLDGLQQELESLLSTVVVRKREVRQEAEVLQNLEKYKGRKHKGSSSPSSKRTSGKESSVHPAKKLKISSGKPTDGGKVKPSKADYDPLENEQIKPVTGATPNTPKNEIPNRFWSFVEPYCAPLTQEDVRFVEELIKGYGDMGEFYRTPPLGQHFAIRWAKEDMELEKAKGGDENKEAKAEEAAPKAVKKETKADSSPFGELTQRLVQGLMEENLMAQVDDVEVMRVKDDETGTRNSFIQSLKVATGDSLERRLRKELEEQGILEPGDEEGEGGGQDEILAELARCQGELRAVSQHNLQQLKRLAKAAREEMARQEVRNRLAEADKEVCEAYKKIAASRSKKKSPSKKEKEVAWKAIKDREAILKQLESI